MSLLLEMFTYPFILRAFAVGILVSLCAALLGVPLVLKRYSMIGDGLSHVSFGALAVAVACGFAPLAFSVPVVVASAFLLLRIAEHSRIGADAAIAVLSDIWGFDFTGESRSVDIHVQQVRRKMGLQGKLITIPKLGYRLERR